MTIVIVAILVFAIVMLLVYNMSIHKKIQTFNSINQRITSLNVLQEFMNTIGDNITVDQKIKKINDILIEKYEIKYSTIVVFDGAEYTIKASNVNEKHWDALKKLQDVAIFKDSISTASPKYVTVNSDGERLPYQEMEFGRAKSAIFFPLYIDNVYIGYWIIESGTPHDFDDVDTTILEVVKENIVAVLKSVVHQKTLESIVRKDLFTGLYSEEYLYGDGKKVIDQYTISTICMFKIINIEQINKNFSRELGNKVITQVADKIKKNLSADYVFVRYMGPKFVIAFSGVETDSVAEFLNDLKNNIEQLEISDDDNTLKLQVEELEDLGTKKLKKKKIQKPVSTSARLNFAISSYYKGTGIEEVLKALENYLDTADTNESNITNI